MKPPNKNSIVKDPENIKNVLQDHVKTDQIVKEHTKEEEKTEIVKELLTEKDKETNNISKPQFKCKIC